MEKKHQKNKKEILQSKIPQQEKLNKQVNLMARVYEKPILIRRLGYLPSHIKI